MRRLHRERDVPRAGTQHQSADPCLLARVRPAARAVARAVRDVWEASSRRDSHDDDAFAPPLRPAEAMRGTQGGEGACLIR